MTPAPHLADMTDAKLRQLLAYAQRIVAQGRPAGGDDSGPVLEWTAARLQLRACDLELRARRDR
jgi:hypothetical protein